MYEKSYRGFESHPLRLKGLCPLKTPAKGPSGPLTLISGLPFNSFSIFKDDHSLRFERVDLEAEVAPAIGFVLRQQVKRGDLLSVLGLSYFHNG